MRNDSLSVPLLVSLAIHVVIVLSGAALARKNHSRSTHLLPVALYDLPRPETPAPPKKIEALPERPKPLPDPPRVKKPPMPKPAETREITPPSKVEPAEKTVAPQPLPAPPPPLPRLSPEEFAKAPEIEPAAPAVSPDLPPNFSAHTQGGGGGSEAGAGNLFGGGDVGVIPGSGTAGGDGGTASSGLGQGSGAPGVAARSAPLNSSREARPIKTAKASYPPLALRAGLESDVSLRIEVDAEGKVTRAEIIKSGGAGFDEEALKAVRQSRFEPAQRDGRNVAAEFVYIYRFRLAK